MENSNETEINENNAQDIATEALYFTYRQANMHYTCISKLGNLESFTTIFIYKRKHFKSADIRVNIQIYMCMKIETEKLS